MLTEVEAPVPLVIDIPALVTVGTDPVAAIGKRYMGINRQDAPGPGSAHGPQEAVVEVASLFQDGA